MVDRSPTDTASLLARAAGIICGASCGLVSECRSREAAAALLEAGLLGVAQAPIEPLLHALHEILRECEEAPTDNDAWVVAIQKIASVALVSPSHRGSPSE